jgi:hypothetical protein
MSNIQDTLDERGTRYGEFKGHAEVTQVFKRAMHGELSKRVKTLTDDQIEALEMIFHKIGRIINGDPDYADSWIDIAGYATLIANRLSESVSKPPPVSMNRDRHISERPAPRTDKQPFIPAAPTGELGRPI